MNSYAVHQDSSTPIMRKPSHHQSILNHAVSVSAEFLSRRYASRKACTKSLCIIVRKDATTVFCRPVCVAKLCFALQRCIPSQALPNQSAIGPRQIMWLVLQLGFGLGVMSRILLVQNRYVVRKDAMRVFRRLVCVAKVHF